VPHALLAPPRPITPAQRKPRPAASAARPRDADLDEQTVKRPRLSMAERQPAEPHGRTRPRRSRWGALADLLVLSGLLGLAATSLSDGGQAEAISAIAAAVPPGTAGLSAAVRPAAVANPPAATSAAAAPSDPQASGQDAPLPPEQPATPTGTDGAGAGAPQPPSELPSAAPVPACDAADQGQACDATIRGKKSTARPRAKVQRPQTPPASQQP
jgi:hypothetical protein